MEESKIDLFDDQVEVGLIMSQLEVVQDKLHEIPQATRDPEVQQLAQSIMRGWPDE